MLRQKTFARAACMALFPRSRFHAEAGYVRRLGYYHAQLVRQARGEDQQNVWPHLEEGVRLELYDGIKRQQFVVLLPGYLNVDQVWVAPHLGDVTNEYEPGHPCSSTQMEYARMLGKKWAGGGK